MDLKLEMIVLPVSDVDRAKTFCEKVGFRLDVYYRASEDFRAVHFTPPGSEREIIFGEGMTNIPPGPFQGLYLIVSDIDEAHGEFANRGIPVSEVFHDKGGLLHHGHEGGRCVHDDEGQWRILLVDTPRGLPTARTSPSATRTATAGCSKK
ncbi:VOC family protein [Streptomyces fagopyri]|uniref:VOC family protein n=1 Tax=Streptomyces fagopyri TaxID=2662397 RepID=UPI0036B00A7B